MPLLHKTLKLARSSEGHLRNTLRPLLAREMMKDAAIKPKVLAEYMSRLFPGEDARRLVARLIDPTGDFVDLLMDATDRSKLVNTTTEMEEGEDYVVMSPWGRPSPDDEEHVFYFEYPSVVNAKFEGNVSARDFAKELMGLGKGRPDQKALASVLSDRGFQKAMTEVFRASAKAAVDEETLAEEAVDDVDDQVDAPESVDVSLRVNYPEIRYSTQVKPDGRGGYDVTINLHVPLIPETEVDTRGMRMPPRLHAPGRI